MDFRASSEPGIIKTFRLFTGVRLALVVFSILRYFLVGGSTTLEKWPYLAFMVLDAGLLLIYLSLPRLSQFLKGVYLPIGIFLATIGPMLELHLVSNWFAGSAPDRAAFILLLQPILVLFIPLIIIGWRYTMRAVVFFSGLTFLLDIILVLGAFKRSGGLDFLSPILGVAFLRTVLFLFIGNMVANLMKTQVEQHRRLAEANERLAQYASTLEQLTISRERNRMARELHDVLAHTMSGVAVELEGVRAKLRVDPDYAEVLLGQSLQAVREGLTETRRALQALRATPLEDLGLGLAIRNLGESIAGQAGLQTDFHINNDLRDFPAEVQQCFYRVAQESFTNIAAHSQARNVQVSLMKDGNGLKLAIRDDGIGFDENAIDLNQKYGLLGMRERVEMIKGELSIVSQPGSGTQILLTYGGKE
ncbi:MAG TPA: hypothetical protein DCP32_03945 [Anaerolineaceae bacterium]|nr:MAG: hypothetical protein A2X24_06555 [Chloroflexi bacterium GWB2_54_36]HAL15918.1 hypothetical protein [Anaerolineaceae bacterium]HBA92795.1 hypothetical protein [Anaerolineaceae bacterium]